MSFMPLHDRVLVRRIEAEAKTASGLLIPDSVQEKPQKGEVIAVGEGGRSKGGELISMSVKAGDQGGGLRVAFPIARRDVASGDQHG